MCKYLHDSYVLLCASCVSTFMCPLCSMFMGIVCVCFKSCVHLYVVGGVRQLQAQ